VEGLHHSHQLMGQSIKDPVFGFELIARLVTSYMGQTGGKTDGGKQGTCLSKGSQTSHRRRTLLLAESGVAHVGRQRSSQRRTPTP
jgi:ribosomal protein S6E (S10)